jgi:cell division protein FtsX
MYRIYQLFRVFWVQNTLACFVGGLIFFLAMLLIQASFTLWDQTKNYLDTYSLQILPHTNVALNKQALNGLLEEIQVHLPEVILEISQDESLTLKGLSLLGDSAWVAEQEGLIVPNQFIIGKYRTRPQKDYQLRLDKIASFGGVQRVDADLNLYDVMTQVKWVAPLGIGLCVALLLVLLFYLIQFVISQLMMVRQDEMALEYLLGASHAYQKAPYWGFIFLMIVSGLGVASVLWASWIHPNWFFIMGWVERLGFQQTNPVDSPLLFYARYPQWTLLIGFGLLAIVGILFQWVWRLQFKRLINQDATCL